MSAERIPKFEALLDHIKRSRGFDFSAYKRAGLMRRVLKSMQTIQVEDFADYIDFLEVHPEEFTRLFNTILINVTAFYRDEGAWEYLSRHVLADILAGKDGGQPIRVWSVGCASGEEAYTLAILLAEALGAEAFQQRVKIYATDVDEEALALARQAVYNEKDLEPIPAALRPKYFEPAGSRYAFRPEFRRSVIFGRHDVVQDAPISRLDLLVCRNTLMYFNGETQSRILARFHFALNDPGYLFLGKAELLLTHGNLFTPVDLKHRIFSKAPATNMRDRLLVAAQADQGGAVNHLGGYMRLREVAFDAAPTAQVVVDASGNLALVNQRARALFGLTVKDIGRVLNDLELSYRPAELGFLVEQAYSERRSVRVTGIEHRLADRNFLYLDVLVAPLFENGGALAGASVTFEDVTYRQRLQKELERSTQELETAYEELQSTHEELETTNEELQSSNEELETTNEELQSSNEELETMNEELQSTNEEMGTINQELRQRTGELNNSNAFLSSILGGLRAGVAVVDRQLNVLIWNHRAEDLWGLRPDEVQGRSLMALDIGLPVAKLPFSDLLAGKTDYEEVVLDATNRRGKAIKCRISCAPFIGSAGEMGGVFLLMEEMRP